MSLNESKMKGARQMGCGEADERRKFERRQRLERGKRKWGGDYERMKVEDGGGGEVWE